MEETAFDARQLSRAAESIAEAGRFLYDRRWSPATSSNYSARLDARHLAITVSGRHKGRLGPEDVMVVDVDGEPVRSRQRSSAETALHTLVYRQLSEVGVVLHTHSVAATVLSRLIAPGESVVLRDYEMQKAFAGVTTHEGVVEVPVFDNTQAIDELAQQVGAWLQAHPEQPGYLIRGHGLYTWGKDMQECLRHVEAFEFLFECELETMRVQS